MHSQKDSRRSLASLETFYYTEHPLQDYLVRITAGSVFAHNKFGLVAHQEISDLDRICPEFCARLMGNTASLFTFLQKRPESAELISGIAGTRTAWKETRQTESFLGIPIDTGKRSTREVEEFNVHPYVGRRHGS